MSDPKGSWDEPGGVFTAADFEGEPTRSPSAWRWLWATDTPFPVRSHRGLAGRLIVALKRLLRPLVKAPQNDLWQRQRVFNLILLERLQALDDRAQQLEEELSRASAQAREVVRQGLEEVMHHNDALFSRVDQKLDRYRRETHDQSAALRSALARLEGGNSEPEQATGEAARASRAASIFDEAERAARYVEFEDRYRGTAAEIRHRLEQYRPWLADRSPAVDLGCGRGEALMALREFGVEARGFDTSVEMVRRCRELGLDVAHRDAIAALGDERADSLAAIVSFHVVEHLAAEQLDRVVDLSFRALRPNGLLLIETPNPESLVVGASRFWIDPTHRRPVHPESLRFRCESAGFASVEVLRLHPFERGVRLPDLALEQGGLEQNGLELGDLADEPWARRVAERVDRLRDRLDDLLFGDQDFAVLAIK